MKRVFCRCFTLVELLTVIAVIAVLSAIGFGTYSTAQNKSRISATRSLVENVANAFEATRAEVGYMPASSGWEELKFDTETIKGTDYFTVSLGDDKFKAAFAKNIDGELVRKFLDGDKLTDSWGNQVYYRYPGIANRTNCAVISAGPDGGFGTGTADSPKNLNNISNFKSSGDWACDDVANF